MRGHDYTPETGEDIVYDPVGEIPFPVSDEQTVTFGGDMRLQADVTTTGQETGELLELDLTADDISILLSALGTHTEWLSEEADESIGGAPEGESNAMRDEAARAWALWHRLVNYVQAIREHTEEA